VRIRPEVLHINDPEYIDEIYPGAAKRRDRYKIAMDAIGTPGTVLTTADYDLHRMRRAAMNPFFSKQSIVRLEPILHDALTTLLQRFEEFKSLQKPVRLLVAFKAFTSDIVYEYAFGERKNDLSHENFNQEFFEEFRKAGTNVHLSSYLPWIPAAIKAFPSVASRISVPLAYFLALDDVGAKSSRRNKP
jgi:cytochrome P450